MLWGQRLTLSDMPDLDYNVKAYKLSPVEVTSCTIS